MAGTELAWYRDVDGWLGDEFLAQVPHPQMVFVLPKRLRPYFLWRRKWRSSPR